MSEDPAQRSMEEIVQALEDRMAVLASRITSDDARERRYASVWLDKLWHLWFAAVLRSPPGG